MSYEEELKAHNADMLEMQARFEKGEWDFVLKNLKRASVEQGEVMGWAEASLLLGDKHRGIMGIPKVARGHVHLAFAGWDGDLRELCEIPVVVAFARGFLFGPKQKHERRHARDMLDLLSATPPEALAKGFVGEPVSSRRLLVSLAFPQFSIRHRGRVYNTPTGLDSLVKWIREDGPEPDWGAYRAWRKMMETAEVIHVDNSAAVAVPLPSVTGWSS